MNPYSLRLDGAGLDFDLGGAGNSRRGASGEDRRRHCAGRSLLLVAAEEARVRTVCGSGRCANETADSYDLPAAGDVVGTLSPVLATPVEVSRCIDWLTESAGVLIIFGHGWRILARCTGHRRGIGDRQLIVVIRLGGVSPLA